MNVIFYLSAIVAIVATLMVITRANVMHALLYLIVSLLSVALVFFTLGAPFVAALEVIVYAGAIMVLFVFAIMLLNQGPQSLKQEKAWLASTPWVGPAVLSVLLLGELIYILVGKNIPSAGQPIPPQQVGVSLYTTYLLGVELVSVLLLSSLIGAYHLGRPRRIIEAAQREEILATQKEFLASSAQASGPTGEGSDGKYEAEKEG